MSLLNGYLKRWLFKLFVKTLFPKFLESHKSLLVLMHFNKWGESGWKLIEHHMNVLAEYDGDAIEEIRSVVERFNRM